MAGENEQTLVDNKDGSFTTKIDGTDVKLVKESDLLAFKGSTETKEASFNSQIAEANRLKDEEHAELLKVQAAKEQSDTLAKESDILKTRVGELDTKVVELTDSNRTLEEELTGRIRSSLADGFGVTEDKIKDKTFTELSSMENTLREAGITSKSLPANYDPGPGGVHASGAKKTPLETCSDEIATARASKS